MNRRVLVTGASGFVGRHLCAALSDFGVEVFAAIGDDGTLPYPSHPLDVCDPESVQAVLNRAGTLDAVVHLAAITFVPEAADRPTQVFDVNLQGTIRLLDGLAESSPDARVLFVGSSEVYGVPQSLPVTESHPLNPNNPYAISKAAADHLCRYMADARGRDIVRVRPFNHSGPGQSDRFVLSSFARQVAEIEAGSRPPVIQVGNLDAGRDFLHVADVVDAYLRLIDSGQAGEVYNVCSGNAYRIRHALDTLLELAETDVTVETDPERVRPVDVPEIRGSYEKLRGATGWQPTRGLNALLRDLLDYWRDHIAAARR